ncbi:MAG: hypothetical protein V1897_14490 [Pseudomonadota bacterium]
MGKVTKFILNFWRVGAWGTIRLPDGRGIFFPWLTGVAHIVPSDKIFHTIRRRMILWKITIVPVGMFLGPIFCMILLKYFHLWEVTLFSVCVVISTCLFPIILSYVRWAKKVTRNLEPFVEEDLDTAIHLPCGEIQKRTAALRSMFYYYVIALLSAGMSIVSAWMLIDVSGNPGNGESVLVAVLGILLGIGGLVVSIIYIRLKRKMPNQDFFQ